MPTFSESRRIGVEREIEAYLWQVLEKPKNVMVSIDADDDYYKTLIISSNDLSLAISLTGWRIRIPVLTTAQNIISLADFQDFITNHDTVRRYRGIGALMAEKQTTPGTRVEPLKPKLKPAPKPFESFRKRRLLRE